MRRRLRVLGLGALAMALCLTAAPAALAEHDGREVDVRVRIPESTPTATADPTVDVSQAVLAWSVNPESGSGAFFGECNFLSAGKAETATKSEVWAAGNPHYKSQAGTVSIEKPASADGSRWKTPTWSDRCMDERTGTPRRVTTSATDHGTGNRVVITGGRGTLNPDTNDATISWQGSFSVVHYSGLTLWWASDPELKVTNGTGTLTALVGGFDADRAAAEAGQTNRWSRLTEKRVALATVRNVDVSRDKGMVTKPSYLGVRAPAADQSAPGTAHHGSFPSALVSFLEPTGQGGYWYSTGGLRDFAKVPDPIYISYSATDRIDDELPPPPDRGGGTSTFVPAPAPSPDTTPAPGQVAPPQQGGAPVAPVQPGGGDVAPVQPPAPTAAGQASALPADAHPGAGGDHPLATTPESLTAVFRLIPEAVVEQLQHPRTRVLVGAALCVVLGTTCFIGFRRGWLSWPWS